MSDNIYELFESRFPEDRSSPFLEVPGEKTFSYADMERESGRYAALLQDLGVTPGDRIAVQVEKSPENVFLYLACLRAGAAYLPLNTAYQRGEIGYFLGDAEPTVFVCRPDDAAGYDDLAKEKGVAHLLTLGADGRGTLVDAAAGKTPVEGAVARQKDDLAAILYTSGTTGRAKGAMLTHENLGSNALALHEAWAWRPGDVLLHILPIFHTHGLFVAMHCAFLNGSPMIFLTKYDPKQVVGLLSRATVMMGVPTHYVRLLEEPSFDRDACANMRLFISGSAPLLEETFYAFEERTGMRILERYGMTECGMNTSNPYDGERVAGAVGPPLPGVEARVTDEDGKVLGTDEVGILEVRGPNVFKGYWRMPEKTAEEFRDGGWFITGDVAKIDAAGYVHIVGRAKDLIISGGFNVYPKEIELIVDEVAGVKESAVIGLPHPDFGEAVTAVCARDGDSATEEDVIGHVKGQLANFKVPKRVFFVDELPRNSMGKVQKNVLREAYEGTFKG